MTTPVNQKSAAPNYVAESKNPPNLVGMVGNLRQISLKQEPLLPGGDYQVLDADMALDRAMNLIPFPLPKMRTQHIDPHAFFTHIGCERAPASCVRHHLEGFYQLVGSYHFSNKLCLRNFLDFDLYSNLKKIHESCPSALKEKIQTKIQQWKKLRADASYAIWMKQDYDAYIRDVDLFRGELYGILKKEPQADRVEYLFPKILKKIDQNSNFLMQFAEKEYKLHLFSRSLLECSGTHPILPTKVTQIPEVLGHFQNFAELIIESMILGNTPKQLPLWNVSSLQEVLTKVRKLATADPNKWQDEARELLCLCKKITFDVTEKVFSHVDVRVFFDPARSGDGYERLFSEQISSIKDISIINKVVGMLESVYCLNEFCHLIEYSILAQIDPEFACELAYANRNSALLRSLLEDLIHINDQKNEVVGLEKLKVQFFEKLANSTFSAKAEVFLSHSTNRCPLMLMNLFIIHLYKILKPLTEETIGLLQEACQQHSADLDGQSLFQETQWLAKALMLVHDLGMRLRDPAITEGIEFHSDYIELIHQYDPSVALQADPVEPESPPETQVCMHMAEPPEPIPPEPAEIKTASVVPPQNTDRPTPPARRDLPLAPRRPPAKLDRAQLQDAIRRTQGDLRKMSKVLRDNLNWRIVHRGKKHPTVVNANGDAVAPVPTTGHAGRGTVGAVANSVCDAAAAQGLM